VDLGAEWTTQSGGYVSLASYYKKLRNYIYDSGGGQANPNTSGVGTVLTKTPTNGGDGHVYGLEATYRQKFQNLPEPFDGLGFSVNATRQNSKVDLGRDGFENERLQSAPQRMANAELFYEIRPIRRVDLHAGYLMNNGLQFDLQISNLTKQYSYWSHIGRNSLANSDIVDAGMTTLLTVKYSF
jgi:outer membrane receptor protein involved in Fe transport